MLLGNPTLNISLDNQFVEKSAPVKDGDEIVWVGFAVVWAPGVARNGHALMAANANAGFPCLTLPGRKGWH